MPLLLPAFLTRSLPNSKRVQLTSWKVSTYAYLSSCLSFTTIVVLLSKTLRREIHISFLWTRQLSMICIVAQFYTRYRFAAALVNWLKFLLQDMQYVSVSAEVLYQARDSLFKLTYRHFIKVENICLYRSVKKSTLLLLFFSHLKIIFVIFHIIICHLKQKSI